MIDALNRDMPFDQFTIEQIAGDMLPSATIEQKIATGFHRNAMTNEEGGVDPEESMYEVLVDRVNTTATVWLGTTLACAQCHNHKYDPFSQKDYFRLLAFFANSDYESRTSTGTARGSSEAATRSGHARTGGRAQERTGRDRQPRAELKTVTPDDARGAGRSGKRCCAPPKRTWTPLPLAHADATNGVALIAAAGRLASWPRVRTRQLTSYTVTVDTQLVGITGLRLEALPDPSLPRNGPGRDGYGHFRVTGIRVEIEPLAERHLPVQPAADRLCQSRRSKWTTRRTRSSRRNCSSPSAAQSRKGWVVGHQRDARHRARSAPRRTGRPCPFGFAGGTRITLTDRSP